MSRRVRNGAPEHLAANSAPATRTHKNGLGQHSFRSGNGICRFSKQADLPGRVGATFLRFGPLTIDPRNRAVRAGDAEPVCLLP